MQRKVAPTNWVALSVVIFGLFSYTLSSANFENYFLEMVPEGDTQKAEDKIQTAMMSVLRRLQLPCVNRVGEVKTQGFFEEVEKRVKEKDPDAHVYVGGGTVRSLLGYVYKKVYTAKQKNPKLPTEAILDKMIRSEKEVLSPAALGMGSELEILIDPSDKGRARQDELKRELTAFANSADSTANLRGMGSQAGSSVIPVVVVKDYREQMNQCMARGGSSLDWLALPLAGGKIGHPEKSENAFKRLIQGEYDYLPEAQGGLVEDPDQQTIRGLRPLLEVPFLHLSMSGTEQMQKELHSLISKVKGGSSLSSGGLEEFERMLRNSRFEGAHNRFYISDPQNTNPEAIEALAFQLSQASKRKGRNQPLIPEFLVHKPSSLRSTIENKCSLNSLLMSEKEFAEKHTQQGAVYHGTPHVDNILSMIRSGFVVSSATQGVAANGRGTYASKNHEIAEAFGIPFELKLKKSMHPRILSWPEVREKPEIRKLAEEARAGNQELFKYLAEKCDVDIIINQYVLIQNSGVFELPKNIQDLIQVYANRLDRALGKSGRDQTLTPEEATSRIKAIVNYEPLFHLGALLGFQGLRPVPDISKEIAALASHPEPGIRESAANGLRYYKADDKKRLFGSLLKDSHVKVREAAARALGYFGADEGIHELYELGLSDPADLVRMTTLASLSSFQGRHVIPLFEKMAQESNQDLLVVLATAITQYSGKEDLDSIYESVVFNKLGLQHKRIALKSLNEFGKKNHFYFIKKALKDPDEAVRKNALESTREFTPQENSQLFDELLENPDPTLRVTAAGQLEKFLSSRWDVHGFSKTEDYFKLLQKVLRDKDSTVSASAVGIFLGYRGSGLKELIREAVGHGSAAVRKAAFANVHSADLDAKDLESILAKGMSEADMRNRMSAASSLMKIPPPKGDSLRKKLLRHENPRVRQAFASGMIYYFGPEERKFFEKLLSDSDPLVFKAAVSGLIEGTRSPEKDALILEVLPRLVEMLKMKDEGIRKEISELIRDLYPGFKGMNPGSLNEEQLVQLKKYVNGDCSKPINEVMPAAELTSMLEYLREVKWHH